MNPRGRQDQLLVEELPGELLVYDLIRNKAHCLNRTAAFIWQQCDGATTVPQIAARLSEQLGLPADEALVWLALDRLSQAGLLQHQPTPPAGHRLLSRRDLIVKLGLAGSLAMLLPVISTANIPTAAAAASPPPCQPKTCVKCKSNKLTSDCCKKIDKHDTISRQTCCTDIQDHAICVDCCNSLPAGNKRDLCVQTCPEP
jgi:hypothetical protein